MRQPVCPVKPQEQTGVVWLSLWRIPQVTGTRDMPWPRHSEAWSVRPSCHWQRAGPCSQSTGLPPPSAVPPTENNIYHFHNYFRDCVLTLSFPPASHNLRSGRTPQTTRIDPDPDAAWYKYFHARFTSLCVHVQLAPLAYHASC